MKLEVWSHNKEKVQKLKATLKNKCFFTYQLQDKDNNGEMKAYE